MSMALLEIFLGLALGVVAGTVTGLIPGLHINLVATLLFSASPFLLGVTSPLALAVFIIAMSITHTFTDFIASVYLGAPDDDTALAVLPGHALLLAGKGYEAVKLTVIGSLTCLVLMVLLVPALVLVTPLIFEALRDYIGYLLIGISLFMVLREKSLNKKFWAFVLFLLAGLLGLAAFSLPGLREPLFPLLSGLFGVSMLLMSLTQNAEIPPQRVTEDISLGRGEVAKASLAGIFSGSLLSIFPGLGPAQAAILATQFYRKISPPIFLVVVGGINTVSMVMSFVTLYTIDRARNGSIVVVQNLLPSFGREELILSLCVALAAGGIATFITLWVARQCSSFLMRVNYKALSICIILFIFTMALFLSGMMGVLILIVSTAIGMIPSLTGIGKNHAMGVLLLPVILYLIL